MTVGALPDDSRHVADSLQAGYFRGFLVTERDQIVAELATSKIQLEQCVAGAVVVGFRAMSQARFEVRDLEARKHDLERMIGALDRRFPAALSPATR